MFCAHLSQNWYAGQFPPGWDLFYGRPDQLIAQSHCFEDYQLDINGIYNLNKEL